MTTPPSWAGCLARWASLLPLLVGCGTGGEEVVLDALTDVTNGVFAAIESEPGWLTAEVDGARVEGVLDNGQGGTIAIRGWRSTSEQEPPEGYHIAFSEKLFLELSRFPSTGLLLSGQVVLTRHAHDFGPPGGTISDANRTTVYRGELQTIGDVEGSFDIDVHAQATGTELWTCGTINDADISVGACFSEALAKGESARYPLRSCAEVPTSGPAYPFCVRSPPTCTSSGKSQAGVASSG